MINAVFTEEVRREKKITSLVVTTLEGLSLIYVRPSTQSECNMMILGQVGLLS